MRYDEQQIIDSYKSGRTIKSIANQYNVSVHPIRDILDRHKIERRRGAGLDKYIDEIISAYKAGQSTYQIAEQYNVSIHPIIEILEQHGIERRKTKGLEKEAKKIIELYKSGSSLKTIAGQYNCTTDPIQRILLINNIPMRPAFIRKIDIKEACELYEKGLSFERIADKYNCDSAAVARILRKQNINSRTPWNKSRKHPLKEDFFEIINTEERAYWLGFLQADGHIPNKSPWHITCSLQIQDYDHLVKMAKAFGSDVQPIIGIRKGDCYGSGKQYARISFGSRRMIDDLNSKGFRNLNRLGDTNIIENIAKDLIKHWLRGFVDGDGSVVISKGSKLKNGSIGAGQAQISVFSPFKSVLKTISNILIDAKLIESANKIGPDGSIWCIRYGGNQKAGNIVKWLYSDAAVYLDRKKIKADAIINNK